MEMGVGIHGERGHETQALAAATSIVNTIAEVIHADLQPQAGQTALLHINGLGATPLMEQYLIYDLAVQFWEQRNINIVRSLVGNYTTSLDMAGISMTLTLLDEEMIKFWDAPVHTANLRWAC